MWDGEDIHNKPYIERIKYFNNIEQNDFIHCAKPREVKDIVNEYHKNDINSFM